MKAIRVPLRRAELVARWRDLAGELELPFDPADLTLGLPADPPYPYSVDRCVTALDRAVARARKRVPRYRLDPDTLTLTVDPRGGHDNLRALVDELRSAAEARHRRLAVAELRAEAASDRLPADRVATRWNASRRTLFNWAAEVQKEPADCTLHPENRAEDVGEVPGMLPAPHNHGEAA